MRNLLMGVALIVLTGCQATGGVNRNSVAPDPKAAELNMRLGLNYLQRGDYAIALEKLEKALKQDPGLASAHNTIAILYQRLGKLKEAEKHYKLAVGYEPEYSQAHNNFGVFLCQQGRYKEAEARFLEAIKNPLYDSPAQAYENAGLCVGRIPEPELAEKYLRTALQINPYLGKSLLRMAELSYDQQDYLRSRGYLERYRQAAKWTPQALLQAIKTEQMLGDENAVASYKILLKGRFPDSEQANQF
jgi:type IV pilus assembly protein PilF